MALSLRDYFEKNKLSPERDSEDFYYLVEAQGEGASPQKGDYVKVHYTGKLLDGTVFDSSHKRNQPFTFQLGQGRVISGWDLGIPKFNVGGKGVLYLPSKHGYGSRGSGSIPPHSPLIFEIEVLDILSAEQHEEEENTSRAKQREAYIREATKQLHKDRSMIADYIEQHNLQAEQTPNGVVVVRDTRGTGPQAEAGKTVSVHYTGKLLDGTKFDSSYDRKEPITFPLGEGRVIPGWEEGITAFREGGKGTLFIPSGFAYGPQQVGPIPPNSILVFDVEIVGVK